MVLVYNLRRAFGFSSIQPFDLEIWTFKCISSWHVTFCWAKFLPSLKTVLWQEAQLSQRGRAMLRVTEYFAKSFKVTRNDTIDYGICKSLLVLHCNCLYLVPFLRYSASNNGVTLNSGLKATENGTVRKSGYGYSHCIAIMAVFLAVSIQYTNVTDICRTTANAAFYACIARQKVYHISCLRSWGLTLNFDLLIVAQRHMIRHDHTTATTYINPLEFTGNYSATSNNMKLVHWPLMGGLLHLAQQWVDWAGP